MLLLALIVGVPLLLLGLAYLSDARSRRRTGHTPSIDESNLRFLDNAPGFHMADNEENLPED